MAKDTLRRTVHVRRPGGERVILKAGSKVPGWASDLVTNPKAFEDYDGADESEATRDLLAAAEPTAGASQVAGFGGDIEEGEPTQVREARKGARSRKGGSSRGKKG